MCDDIMLFETREAAENRAILVPECRDTCADVDDFTREHIRAYADSIDGVMPLYTRFDFGCVDFAPKDAPDKGATNA